MFGDFGCIMAWEMWPTRFANTKSGYFCVSYQVHIIWNLQPKSPKPSLFPFFYLIINPIDQQTWVTFCCAEELKGSSKSKKHLIQGLSSDLAKPSSPTTSTELDKSMVLRLLLTGLTPQTGAESEDREIASDQLRDWTKDERQIGSNHLSRY